MQFFEYMTKAFSTWFIGFFPYFEVYAAVAAGMAMGLDGVSAVVWAVFGNFTPIPLLLLCYRQLTRVRRIRLWLERLEKRGVRKVKHAFDRYGAWFLVLMTPILGSWTIAVIAPITGIQPKQVMLFSFVGILLYAIATAVLVASGINWFNHH
ncbi:MULTISPECIES: small multi-drug export protein [unclassified Microcoleus]|jgi:uncharacterized membrane protein|uniref:small multi-drug export protein n=2 Tax=unclassified Microcoleus TaxID=2642155 RepID=UPI001DAB12BE|nr:MULTISPECIES: small multi-drug export protein [unclassified Microcoleus]MCC3506334.1 small multi-drug export protein [Microcoleus sp. PH2017_19_SFW_U_A]MCC3523192.1 small multi-drug export protein [Microcoleus sp. PH2017_20_SFW_D_A]MCC3547849.1 small multi-drug export protein [Microcoleus sp. PH2017_24_DOB_U_A]MCC3553838.1 small multi-drug export protein [Microcoleus sp. PH2017_35_SFW_U_B]MCC3567012.1 small multi-drug export protein [Microcoleus sp. PH2017_31_RDM_U_A]TAE07452.1 MAG: hypoth